MEAPWETLVITPLPFNSTWFGNPTRVTLCQNPTWQNIAYRSHTQLVFCLLHSCLNKAVMGSIYVTHKLILLIILQLNVWRIMLAVSYILRKANKSNLYPWSEGFRRPPFIPLQMEMTVILVEFSFTKRIPSVVHSCEPSWKKIKLSYAWCIWQAYLLPGWLCDWK